MTETLSGSCYCKVVRYTLGEGPRSPVYACHCTDCQTRTGSAFSEHMTVQLDDLRVEGGFDQFAKARPNGSDYALVGCPKCKVAIYGASGLSPARVTLRCGTLDRSPAIAPSAHFWVRSK